mmetsp:Transcript_27819/g.26639  ORF Transcript_27819/g.26639 Transcript_27819/m.26639 type:complete len:434 (-) Transcript_27819:338-1639(-)|eukprot:CAMPEP_0119040666 /NCGR_PEP_ID=MMETSP1177-20130426/10681_1 /TAXON_ID=2985 /ORGANISM="Ochromonas sp, Strain CCMP1899" /LENGTH=433 /DNA_ID=CAMNT_0007005961 /DNA_START=202 /DNA_END=1503 /DNA_ORIENTATION=+
MSRRNAPAVLNLSVKRTGSSDNSKQISIDENADFPDVSTINERYGLDTKVANEITIESEIRQNSDLTEKTETLFRKLQKKDHEIEKLCILLETLEPIPGINVESMRKHLESTPEDGADFRDAKIVSLAKKNRNLTVILNKERASSDSRGLQIQELADKLQQLERQGSISKKDAMDKESQQEIVNLRKELTASNKTVDDLRRKTFQATEETKQLSRALANELGEGVSIEKAIEGSWRGRAQQIIVLKAKVKKLESAVGDVSSSGTVMSAGNVSRTKRIDVDTKAQEDLAEMSLERKHAIDCIVEEKETLSRDNQLLEEKVKAHKARIKNLEADGSRQKQQIKVVLDVKDSDDELIDALQQEIQRFKVQAKTRSGVQRDETTSRQTPAPLVKSQSSFKNDELQADLSRLQRLCKSQGDQISTQDEVIRSLRSRLG